jgi:hypothetical protein
MLMVLAAHRATIVHFESHYQQLPLRICDHMFIQTLIESGYGSGMPFRILLAMIKWDGVS